jgi:hypothetical protein
VDVTIFCSKTVGFVPRNVNLRDLNQTKKQTMLLAYFILSIVSATYASRIPKLKEDNVVEHQHA